MLDFKGTKGPHRRGETAPYDIVEYDGRIIARVHPNIPLLQAIANATLFANALRLAEALDALLAVCARFDEMAQEPLPRCIVEARAALAAALGKTP